VTASVVTRSAAQINALARGFCATVPENKVIEPLLRIWFAAHLTQWNGPYL